MSVRIQELGQIPHPAAPPLLILTRVLAFCQDSQENRIEPCCIASKVTFTIGLKTTDWKWCCKMQSQNLLREVLQGRNEVITLLSSPVDSFEVLVRSQPDHNAVSGSLLEGR